MDQLFYGMALGRYADIQKIGGELWYLAKVPRVEVNRLADRFGFTRAFAVERYRYWMDAA